jgi:hypothetical protein
MSAERKRRRNPSEGSDPYKFVAHSFFSDTSLFVSAAAAFPVSLVRLL